MTTCVLRSIQVGKPRTYAGESDIDWMRRPWSTGIFKSLVAAPVRLGATQLEGDGQADLTVHGGPDKAVCVYSADHYAFWRSALGEYIEGAEFPFGAFGENLTLEGVTEDDVCIGDVWAVGDEAGAMVQVSQPRQPCWKLAQEVEDQGANAGGAADAEDGVVLSRLARRRGAGGDEADACGTAAARVDGGAGE